MEASLNPATGRRRIVGAGPAITAFYVLVAALAFATAHTGGDFWWSDAPRHALNGLFVLDFVKELPFSDPVGFAERYYVQYPSLTILFYPPLTYAIMAAAYGLFGETHAVAQATISVFFAGVLFVSQAIARRYLPTAWAVVATLLFACAPQFLFWSRQVMVDTPAIFFQLAAALALLRYTDQWQPRWIWLSCAAFVAAVYCKYNVAFAAPALVGALLAAGGIRVLVRREVLAAAVVSAIALIPAAVLMIWFGRENVASVQGSLRDDLPVTDIRAWLVYARFLPEQLGSVAVVALVLGWAGLLASRLRGLRRPDLWLWLTWLVVGYLLFSYIKVREPRHTLTVLFPFVLLGTVGLRHALERVLPSAGSPVGWFAAALAAAHAAWGAVAVPAPYIDGYAAAVASVGQHGARTDRVLFHGYRDGTFVYDMRVNPTTRAMTTIRSDKLIARVSIERARGISDRGLDQTAMRGLFRRLGIRWVVAQSGFWGDLAYFRDFEALLDDRSMFEPSIRIPIRSDRWVHEHELVVYRYVGPVDDPPAPIAIEIGPIGRNVRH